MKDHHSRYRYIMLAPLQPIFVRSHKERATVISLRSQCDQSGKCNSATPFWVMVQIGKAQYHKNLYLYFNSKQSYTFLFNHYRLKILSLEFEEPGHHVLQVPTSCSQLPLLIPQPPRLPRPPPCNQETI